MRCHWGNRVGTSCSSRCDERFSSHSHIRQIGLFTGLLLHVEAAEVKRLQGLNDAVNGTGWHLD